MKREEAIKLIDTHTVCFYNEIDSPTLQALHMAIEALSADRPRGEWTYLHGSIGSYMTISCPFCGTTFNDVAEWEYNYCPSCGAKMRKGGDSG